METENFTIYLWYFARVEQQAVVPPLYGGGRGGGDSAHDVEAAERLSGRGRGQGDLRGPEHRDHHGGGGGAAHPVVSPAGELLTDLPGVQLQPGLAHPAPGDLGVPRPPADQGRGRPLSLAHQPQPGPAPHGDPGPGPRLPDGHPGRAQHPHPHTGRGQLPAQPLSLARVAPRVLLLYSRDHKPESTVFSMLFIMKSQSQCCSLSY